MRARVSLVLAALILGSTTVACGRGSHASSAPDVEPEAGRGPHHIEHESLADAGPGHTRDDAGNQPKAPLATSSADSGDDRMYTEPRPDNTIYRHELERATHGGRPPYLMRQLGPEAHRPGGRFIGWKITRVWPDDPQLCAPGCDLRPGDVIVSVNGKPLQYPEELSDLMAKVSTMETLNVQMLRNGKLRRVEYDIADPSPAP